MVKTTVVQIRATYQKPLNLHSIQKHNSLERGLINYRLAISSKSFMKLAKMVIHKILLKYTKNNNKNMTLSITTLI
jgi:hypothetical protein